MHGLAEGAEMEFEQILALTTAYEKSFARDQVSDKCTAFMASSRATKDGKVIVGQTNDECFTEWLYQLECSSASSGRRKGGAYLYASWNSGIYGN